MSDAFEGRFRGFQERFRAFQDVLDAFNSILKAFTRGAPKRRSNELQKYFKFITGL